jgi:chromosome segregation ATPase
MLTRLLAAAGLVRAPRYAAVVEQLRKVEARAARATQAVEEARVETRDWKAKAGAAEKHLNDAERDAARQSARAEKIKADLGAQLETERGRLAEFQAMRTRLADAERDIAVARDHLMAVEVKLDILEGAANVLDARTRTVLASPTKRESGAPA